MKIDEQIRVFAQDFAKKVYPIFVQRNWRWARHSGVMYNPNEQDILSMTLYLIEGCNTTISTGRIKASLKDQKLTLCLIEYGETSDIEGFKCSLDLSQKSQKEISQQTTKRWQDAWYERYD